MFHYLFQFRIWYLISLGPADWQGVVDVDWQLRDRLICLTWFPALKMLYCLFATKSGFPQRHATGWRVLSVQLWKSSPFSRGPWHKLTINIKRLLNYMGGSRTCRRRGCQPLKRGRQTNIYFIFSEKPHEIKEILVCRGTRAGSVPLRSATGFNLWYPSLTYLETILRIV